MEIVRIFIGDIHVSVEPVVIYTLLGSCVAVCLYDSLRRIGGMNHILLPGKADTRHFNNPARYGINAMELLINEMLHKGAVRSSLKAKVFGGGHILSSISKKRLNGIRNIDFIFEFLKAEGIPIINSDVGGNDTRRIFFYSDTADVFLKRSNAKNWAEKVIRESLEFKNQRKKVEYFGDITLFTS